MKLAATPALFLFCAILGACATVESNSKMSGNQKIQVFMAGDSTMAIKDPKDYPETGWGVPFATFFNNSINVINLAKNGRSTRTFIEEGLWKQITDNLRPGDFVFIQFGHNDESELKVDRYTTPSQYRENINRFINDVESKKAHAILCTPVVRRHFDQNGILKKTHPYADIVRKIAKQHDEVVFIDMEKITEEYFQGLGVKDSIIRFMHMEPGLHPNYPDGMEDDTHYNELGAREVAQLALLELKRIEHPLTKQLRDVDPKHLRK